MKKVTLVLGLKKSGLAAAEFLLRQNCLVLGIDCDCSLLQTCPEIQRCKSLGLFVQHDSDPVDWSRVDRLVVSPGVSPKHLLYKGARENGILITGEVELALSHFRGKLLAVTGTNGKTTVTLLTEHILRTAGIKARALGNVGTPLCKYLLNPCDAEVFVIELSSYQLETMHTPVFDAAALLNITPDHLERYESMEEYIQAKCHLQHLMKPGASFFVQKQVASYLKNVQTFGFEKECDLWTDQIVMTYREKVECILPLNYREMGKHDCENAMAAWALCCSFSISKQQFSSAFSSFKKPSHRVEFIRNVGGVSFYDDSKGTNIDAVVQAVRTMKGPVILIAGGVDKGASYMLWKEHFLGKVKQIVAIGQAAPKIYSELHPYFTIKLADTLEAAVQVAAIDAESGDSVLLSPGCSSFDMFQDYAHRGAEFQRNVNIIKGEDHEP